VSVARPNVLRRVAHPLGVALLRGRHRLRRLRTGDHSSLGEQDVVRRLLGGVQVDHRHAVDIAACDGVTNSNTLALYESGWAGLAVEGDPARFAALARAYRRLPGVALARSWVTPENVVPLLHGHRVPREPGLLNLDIDGYDHFVLAALLEEFRPTILCAEINEKIPPPLKFTVRYDPDYVWAEDHFYGQSLSALHELATAYGYALVELHYNNAFLVPRERAAVPGLAPEEAYATGYLDRPDRLELFPWNADMEELHSLTPERQLEFVEERFAQYRGKFDLSL